MVMRAGTTCWLRKDVLWSVNYFQPPLKSPHLQCHDYDLAAWQPIYTYTTLPSVLLHSPNDLCGCLITTTRRAEIAVIEWSSPVDISLMTAPFNNWDSASSCCKSRTTISIPSWLGHYPLCCWQIYVGWDFLQSSAVSVPRLQYWTLQRRKRQEKPG